MHTEGLSCLRRSVLEDPEYKEAWQLLAHMLSWGYALYVPFLQPVSLDGLDEAEKAIDQAIRIDKDFARAYATRAELAFHKRDWSRLVEYAKKAYSFLLGKEKLLVNGKDGLNSVELINAMVLSGLEEEKIELPLDEARYEQKLEEMIGKSR